MPFLVRRRPFFFLLVEATAAVAIVSTIIVLKIFHMLRRALRDILKLKKSILGEGKYLN